MPAGRLVIDGLWRCLCPSIDRISTKTLQSAVSRSGLRPRSSPRSLPLRCQRLFSSTPSAGNDGVQELTEDGQSVPNDVHIQPANQFEGASISELHAQLKYFQTQAGAHDTIVALVNHLVNVRGDKPSQLHYNAMFKANSAGKGSAETIGLLLDEMEGVGLAPDSETYHSILQALAVHPDYVIRIQVLQKMKDRWFSLAVDGWHNLIIGLLRDKQYELALDKLTQMQSRGVVVHGWLYDMFIYLLCEAEEFDQALSLLQYRVDSGDLDIAPSIWFMVLDTCSRQFHYAGTLYVWRRRVETRSIVPTDGMCINVLNTAARHYDAALATDCIRALTKRAVKLDATHYEALVSVYCGTEDLRTALLVLNIMQKSGVTPTQVTTRPIIALLASKPELLEQAFAILRKEARNSNEIPVAAMDVALEAMVATRGISAAMEQYRSMTEIVPSGPLVSTFNVLLHGCQGSKETAMFLASEMATRKIKPDILTYDRLILVCLNDAERDYEDALRYLQEMRMVFKGEGPRNGTWHALVKRCAQEGDTRTWALLKEMEGAGISTTNLSRWVHDVWHGMIVPEQLVVNTRESVKAIA